MFSCPTSDIHSIYIDNELPQEYLKAYSEHLKVCPKCQKELENLKKTKNLFVTDNKSFTLDEHFLNESFDRLQTKLRYSKNTKFTKKEEKNYTKYFIPIASAAAIFIAVIIPFSNFNSSTKTNANIAKIQPIERPNQSISRQNVVLNGNLNTDLTQNVSIQRNNKNLKDLEVFKPNFNNNRNFPIQDDFPEIIGQGNYSMDIKIPQIFYTGNLSDTD